jgi:nucleoid DNA-binding protein
MNKRQLVAAAARRTALTQGQARQVLDAILETIAEVLAEGGCVALSDFGRFEAKPYPGRRLRQFGGAGRFVVEDRPVPVFRSSAALRRRVKEKRS